MKDFDRRLLLLVFSLIGLGLVQVYSASYIYATEVFGNGLYFFFKQLIFVASGVFVLLTAGLIPWRLWERYGWLIYVVAVGLLSLTLIPGLGHRVGGASRWLALPLGFRFEPAELLKVGAPLLLASLLQKRHLWFPGFFQSSNPTNSNRSNSNRANSNRSNSNRASFILALVLNALVWLPPVVILLSQPDFGTFFLLSVTLFLMLFVYGLRKRVIFAAFVAMAPAFFFFVYRVPYRWARIEAFLDPWADPTNKGFQVIQGLTSFVHGRFMGVGLGQGQGKLFFLPEAHTDFTFAVLGEELGLLGVVSVLVLYGLLILRCYQISFSARSEHARAALIGLTALISISIFTNLGMVLGLIPTKGLTLPFLSYGGSSLICSCLAFGLFLSLSRQEGETK